MRRARRFGLEPGVEQPPHQRRGVAPREQRRDRAHDDGVGAERVEIEAEGRGGAGPLGEPGDLSGRDRERERDEQQLALDLPLAPARAQPLEEHALVRGVLIDQQQALLGLDHEVGREQRAQKPQIAEAQGGVRLGGVAHHVRRRRAACAGAANSQSPDGPCGLAPAAGRRAGAAVAAGASQRRVSIAAATPWRTRRCSAGGSAKRTSHFAGCTFTSTASGGSSTKSTAVGKRPRGSQSR